MKEKKMKPAQGVFIAIGLIAIAVMLAGCTSSTPSGTGGQTGAAVSAAATSAGAASANLQPGATVDSASLFGKNANWFEYVMTSTVEGKTTTMTMRTDRSTDTYKGAAAIHYKNTMNAEGMTSVTDIYYDTTMTNILGGTMTTTVGGKSYTMDIPAEQLKKSSGPTFEKKTALTYQGPDAVTVPAGTYAAGKYTATTDGTPVTYWVAGGVPLPVKYTTSAQGVTMTAELKGWG
jgi:hypothetical protein